MIDNYKIEIDFKVFERVMQGKCTFIALVNDKSRQLYKVGNMIELETIITVDEKEKKTECVSAQIVNLLYFENVKDLVDMISKERIGYPKSANIDKIEDNFIATYSNEGIEKFGLVAVEFILN